MQEIIHSFFDRSFEFGKGVFGACPAIRIKQVHGIKVIEVDAPMTEWIEADGLVTRTHELPIGIITADCAPVLFYADGVIGAAHAGWRGALDGVLDETIRVMDVDPASIHAMIGPCIAQKSYEVSAGFETPFLKRDAQASQFFTAGQSTEKLQFDLAGYCAFRLRQCGVQSIDIDGRDTLADPAFYSHRGGATNKERNLSAIMIRR